MGVLSCSLTPYIAGKGMIRLIGLIEIIGTAAFAVSGALVGIKKRLDLFGVLVVALLTSGGGGLMRDLFLNRDVPVFFSQCQYLITILIFTIIALLVGTKSKTRKKYTNFVYLCDAIGLGVFSIVTADSAIQFGYPNIGVVFLSCLTGIGGGMMRDIIVREIPVVLRREIYALASIAGVLLLLILYPYIEHNLLIYSCVAVVVIIRMCSIHFDLHIPVVNRRPLDSGNAAGKE